MKIVITGGLGYIGTELCRLYSGESRIHEVVVLDNRFLPERVKQLGKWNIKYVQGSISDKNLVKKILDGADIIHHLAGITDVAYVKNDENLERDKLIYEVGVEGTRNIINYCPPSAKIIFPSSHVVFEGIQNGTVGITESYFPKPELTYAKGKLQSEEDLRYSGKNFIILRLGSCYGYSSDSMRINIMPNLFSKITAQSGKIKLFSGGVQYKSVVHVIDVARCFKFFAEKNYTNDCFHVANESLTVKAVATICREINPDVEITETSDEIPNIGYSLSNQKLLATGFKFQYNIYNAIKDMIEKWSQNYNSPNEEIIIKGDKEFVDERGAISNYELTEPVNLIATITSKAGSIRANHYHPIQEQKCLLISGQYISVTKDLLVKNSNICVKTVNPGDLSIIPPNVAHTMIFTKDSVFINLVNGEREHSNYGITHTIPYKLI